VIGKKNHAKHKRAKIPVSLGRGDLNQDRAVANGVAGPARIPCPFAGRKGPRKAQAAPSKGGEARGTPARVYGDLRPT
jgi:hypothetical protein